MLQIQVVNYHFTNCNASFGENALLSDGFKKSAFTPDNAAYITQSFHQKKLLMELRNVDYLTTDVDKTIGVGVSTRLYFEDLQIKMHHHHML